MCLPLTCTTSQSQSGRKQTSRCWILRRPSAAEVWPASHIPSAGWRRTGRIHPLSRRSSRTWRSSSVWSPDAGLQSPGRSWRWLAVLSLPSPFRRNETKLIWDINWSKNNFIILMNLRAFLRLLSVYSCSEKSSSVGCYELIYLFKINLPLFDLLNSSSPWKQQYLKSPKE